MKTDLSDTLVLMGLLLFFYGVFSIYPPAAFILSGSVIVAFGFFRAAVKRGDEK